MLSIIAFAGDMMVVGGMREGASLIASEKTNGDRSNIRPGSTLAGRGENLRDIDRFKAGHDGHGLGGEG